MGGIVSSVLEPFTGAKKTQAAANQAAAQQSEAAQKAGVAASFRPVGISTRFGTSQFTEKIDPVSGLPRVTAAGYEIDPQLKAIQDRVLALTGGALGTAEQAQAAAMPIGMGAQGLFSLGQQFLPTTYDTTQAAQDYFNQQMAMLDPVRQREEQRLGAGVFGRGRAGLNIGDIGQPELYSLATARREQDTALADAARQRAREELQQDIGFGANLFGTGASLLGQQYAVPTQALAPLQTYLGTAGTIEELGQQPFQLGMQVGGAGAQAGSAAGNLLGSGLTQAAQTQYQGVQAANAANAGFLSGLLQTGASLYGGSKGWFK
jgi:hypothetical protein